LANLIWTLTILTLWPDGTQFAQYHWEIENEF